MLVRMVHPNVVNLVNAPEDDVSSVSKFDVAYVDVWK